MDKNYDVITFISKYFLLRRPRVANFADIKIATMFIKTTFKGSKKVKRIRNYVLKCNLYVSLEKPIGSHWFKCLASVFQSSAVSIVFT